MKRICVYCGSQLGTQKCYSDGANQLGLELAKREITLIYGGGNVGLMGVIADSVLSSGGKVIGVIPKALVARELAHKGLTELHIVKSMHERKAMMAELSDAFIALPGGFGTLEEFTEITTWTQLGIHNKALGLLNIENYYDGLLSFLDHAVTEGFIQKEIRSLILSSRSPSSILDELASIEVPKHFPWVDLSHS